MENKTSKYFKYAIGEIILVVIGILIALQINNWNENRVNRIEEVKILKALKVDFSKTKKRIENTISKQQNVVNFSKKLQSLITEKKQSDSIGEYLYTGVGFWRIEPVNGTYDGLIGSGKIGIITNDILKTLLTEYSSEFNYGFEDEKADIEISLLLIQSTSNVIKVLLPAPYQNLNGYSKTYSLNEIQKAQQELIDNSSFSGLLVTKTRLARNRLNYHKHILEYVIKIINEIESELNNLEK